MCVVCLRGSVGGGGGDVAEARWLGHTERAEELALVGGEFGALGEFAVGGAEVALLDRQELVADRAPRGDCAQLGDADDHQREEADQHVGADAVLLAVEDGAQQQRGSGSNGAEMSVKR